MSCLVIHHVLIMLAISFYNSMSDKPVECSVPTHDWEKISGSTIISIVTRTSYDIDVPGDLHTSVFRCKRCKVLRFFSNK